MKDGCTVYTTGITIVRGRRVKGKREEEGEKSGKLKGDRTRDPTELPGRLESPVELHPAPSKSALDSPSLSSEWNLGGSPHTYWND